MSQSNVPPWQPSGNRSTGGSGGGGGSSMAEYLIAQETNRQILLILVRLREDTNNVLTRLSFLESSVISLQVSHNHSFVNTNKCEFICINDSLFLDKSANKSNKCECKHWNFFSVCISQQYQQQRGYFTFTIDSERHQQQLELFFFSDSIYHNN